MVRRSKTKTARMARPTPPPKPTAAPILEEVKPPSTETKPVRSVKWGDDSSETDEKDALPIEYDCCQTCQQHSQGKQFCRKCRRAFKRDGKIKTNLDDLSEAGTQSPLVIQQPAVRSLTAKKPQAPESAATMDPEENDWHTVTTTVCKPVDDVTDLGVLVRITTKFTPLAPQRRKPMHILPRTLPVSAAVGEQNQKPSAPHQRYSMRKEASDSDDEHKSHFPKNTYAPTKERDVKETSTHQNACLTPHCENTCQPPKRYCSDCRAVYVGKESERRSEHVRAALIEEARTGVKACGTCSNRIPEERRYCASCRAAHQSEERECKLCSTQTFGSPYCRACKREWALEGRVCNDCATNPAEIGKNYCHACMERYNDRNKFCKTCNAPTSFGRQWCKKCQTRYAQELNAKKESLAGQPATSKSTLPQLSRSEDD